MKKKLIQDDELDQLCEKVIEEKNMNLDMVTIKCVLVEPNITKTVAGKCIRANKEIQHFAKCDYLIEMSSDLWNVLDYETQYILMYHELKHIKPVFNEKQGEYIHKIRPHDVEDFRDIINEHGIDWIQTVKTTVASIYDFDPDMEEEVSI